MISYKHRTTYIINATISSIQWPQANLASRDTSHSDRQYQHAKHEVRKVEVKLCVDSFQPILLFCIIIFIIFVSITFSGNIYEDILKGTQRGSEGELSATNRPKQGSS